MHTWFWPLFLLAAGAAWELHRQRSAAQEESPVLSVSEDTPDDGERTAAAEVLHCVRRMDFLTLSGASDVSFLLADGTELDFHITGEGCQHLQIGDSGMLTWSGESFILFEKDNGEIVGGLFYSPAESEDEAHD